VGHYDYNQLRNVCTQALNIIHSDSNFPPHIASRVYTMIMAGCGIEEKSHWLSLIKKILTKKRDKTTKFARLFTILFLPADLKSMEPFVTQYDKNLEEFEQIKDYYNQAVEFIDKTEEIVIEDMEDMNEEQINYAKSVIYGARSILYNKFGSKDSLYWANEAMDAINFVNIRIRPGSRISIMYAMTASLLSGQTTLYDKGISVIKSMRTQWPLINLLYGKLLKLKEYCETKFALMESVSLENNQSNPFLVQSNNSIQNTLFTGSTVEIEEEEESSSKSPNSTVVSPYTLTPIPYIPPQSIEEYVEYPYNNQGIKFQYDIPNYQFEYTNNQPITEPEIYPQFNYFYQ